MGEVFVAVDDALGRKVAVKILSEAHRNNAELRARFVREARAVAAISHPNVVQVFTTGEHDGKPYIAMEYLSGRDLGLLVREHGPLDSLTIAGAIRDAAAGLAAAARAGLIHRDVKPSNLMLLGDGSVKVTDFGLAKPVKPQGEDPALTAMGVVVGTPDYIAPEQARGEAIDSRVDVYALGCTLFFLFTGRPPYRKSVDDPEKYLKVVARHLRDPVPDPRKEVNRADEELVELQFQMMAKTAEERPTYDTILATLDGIRARISGVAAPIPRAKTSPPPVESAAESRARAKRAVKVTDPSMPSLPAGREGAAADVSKVGGSSLDFLRPKRSRGLLAVTVLAALVFLTGAAVKIFGPLPPAAKGVAAGDGGPGVNLIHEDAGPPAHPAVAPAGMLIVKDPLGHPLFYVDRVPVTNAAYHEWLPSHRFKPAEADRPVEGVSYDLAAQYAAFRGKRLLEVTEWQAALDTVNFVPAGMRVYEWVDDASGPAAPDRAVRGVNGGEKRVKASGDPTVTFRLAKDL